HLFILFCFLYYLIYYIIFFFFFLIIRPPPISTLFPYTTLFRSIFIPKLRLILILNSFLGSSDSLVFSELFHSKNQAVATSQEAEIGRAVQQECRDRSRMPSSA